MEFVFSKKLALSRFFPTKKPLLEAAASHKGLPSLLGLL
jgi:hypothetical protein